MSFTSREARQLVVAGLVATAALGATSTTANAATTRAVAAAAAADTERPSAPGAPVITEITSTSAKLTWPASTDDVGVVSYEVRYDDYSFTTTTNSITLTKLIPDSEYLISIVAKDAAGNRSESNDEGTFFTPLSTDTQAPVAPKAPTASAVTETSLKLSWPATTDNVGVVGYDVLRDGTLVASTAADVLTTDVTGLTQGTSYKFTIQARDLVGNKSTSPATTVKTIAPDTIAPTAPGTPAASAITQTTATLTWTASTDAVGVAGYDVYNGDAKIAGTTGATTVALTGLVKGTSYSLTVKARDAAGNVSGSSAAGTFRTASDVVPTPIKYSYDLKGSATLKTLSKGALPITGGIDAELILSTGAFTADLRLNPTKARLTTLGFLPVTASVAFVTSGKTVGTIDQNTGALTSTSNARIKLPSVTLLGIPLAGGTNCQTRSLSKITLTDPTFDALQGGTLKGTFAISDLSGCGILNGIVSPLTAGTGNSISAVLTKKAS